MRPDLPTGTVTFLFTDIEGSTRLLHALGTDEYAEALADHRRLLREAFAVQGGVEVDTQGDAFFFAFPTATGAAVAARTGHQTLAAGPIRVRIGLHTGAPSVTDEGYVGVDVHRGARIASVAHGGQTIVSAGTAGLLDGAELRDLGLHRLKDFDGAVRLYQLGAGTFPAVRTPGSVELPTPATAFLGREAELLDAASLVLEHDPRLLTIVGPGGTGKTRFAIELARLLAEDADGGTLFLPFAPIRDPSLVLPTVADALGAESAEPTSIGTRVGEKRTTLVLDNLEQLLPDAATALASLTEAAPGLRLLATSREALRIGAETQFDLPPLHAGEAVELFLVRARAVRHDIHRTPAVDELCSRLDRLPLAIELAAARAKLLSPEALLERLGQRLDLPAPRDADPRHATLRATIAWSYDLLDPAERRLFARLAVFPAGCTLADAEAVCEADFDTVASLLDKSLLRRRSDPDGSDRFWMLETIGEFAAARLAESGEEDELRGRQIDALLRRCRLAGAHAVVYAHVRVDLALVTPELDNVRASLAWSLDRDRVRGLRLATALEEFWVIRDPTEGADWLERLLDAASDAPTRLRADALRALGGARDIVGDHERAAPAYRESVEAFEELGEELHVANLRFRIAANLLNRGEAATAAPLLDAAHAEFERLGDRRGEAQTLAYYGFKSANEGDLPTAAEFFEQSAAIVHELGWTWWEGNMEVNLAEIRRRLGQLDEAERHARRSLELAQGIGDRRDAIFAMAELAAAAALRDDSLSAGRLWGALESELDAAPVGHWPRYGGEFEAIMLGVAGTEFEQARSEGRLLTLAAAAGLEPASPDQTLP